MARKPAGVDGAGGGPPGVAGSGTTGATISTTYLHRNQDVTVVDVNDLREFQESINEEFWIFSASQFFIAGSFWLGVERILTVDNILEDPVFLGCAAFFLAGCACGVVGYRQIRRRKAKIERIIEAAETYTQTTAATH